MKTLNLFLLVFITLILIQNVSAVIVVPVDNSPAAGQNNNLNKEALKFSEEHNCDLTFANKYTVNKYSCTSGFSTYTFKINSEGSITNLNYEKVSIEIIFIIVFVVALFIIFFICIKAITGAGL